MAGYPIDHERVRLIDKLSSEQLALFERWVRHQDWLQFHIEQYD